MCPLLSIVLPFCEIQTAHKAATLQMHCASTTSFDSSSSASSSSSGRCQSLRRLVSLSGLMAACAGQGDHGPTYGLACIGNVASLELLGVIEGDGDDSARKSVVAVVV